MAFWPEMQGHTQPTPYSKPESSRDRLEGDMDDLSKGAVSCPRPERTVQAEGGVGL
jgi:hypothetical protein